MAKKRAKPKKAAKPKKDKDEAPPPGMDEDMDY